MSKDKNSNQRKLRPWMEYKLHIVVFFLVIIAEFISIRKIYLTSDVCIVLMPLLYAMIMGLLLYLAKPSDCKSLSLYTEERESYETHVRICLTDRASCWRVGFRRVRPVRRRRARSVRSCRVGTSVGAETCRRRRYAKPCGNRAR